MDAPYVLSRDWKRCVLLVLLWPILWLQGRYVRRVTPHFPTPQGPLEGRSGTGLLIRVLVAGDSGAAGVGVPILEQALCGQLVRHLSRRYAVEWCLLAANGLDSPGLLKLLQAAPAQPFDVVVLSIGANDATRLCPPAQWVEWQGRLADVVQERFAPGLLVHSAVPPMHACHALPQPLRWFMGRWAFEMNALLAERVRDDGGRTMHWHPETTTTVGLATDGIHPNSAGYTLWADGLGRHILGSHTPCGASVA